MATLLTLGVIAAVIAVVYNMWLFDCLVRWEYQHHRGQWERDGKPDGYFWRPPECAAWSSDLAKKRVGLEWLFCTPEWAERSDCRRWLAQMRIISIGASIAVLALSLRIFLHLGFG